MQEMIVKQGNEQIKKAISEGLTGGDDAAMEKRMKELIFDKAKIRQMVVAHAISEGRKRKAAEEAAAAV